MYYARRRPESIDSQFHAVETNRLETYLNWKCISSESRKMSIFFLEDINRPQKLTKKSLDGSQWVCRHPSCAFEWCHGFVCFLNFRKSTSGKTRISTTHMQNVRAKVPQPEFPPNWKPQQISPPFKPRNADCLPSRVEFYKAKCCAENWRGHMRRKQTGWRDFGRLAII